MDAKVSSEDSGLRAQSLPSISAGNLHSLSSDSILASVTSNQIPENAEIRKYVPVMNPTDSGVYQSENGGQGNFPSQAPENSVNPKDSLYVHSGHSAQSHKITPQPLLHPATGELIPIPIHIVDDPEDPAVNSQGGDCEPSPGHKVSPGLYLNRAAGRHSPYSLQNPWKGKKGANDSLDSNGLPIRPPAITSSPISIPG